MLKRSDFDVEWPTTINVEACDCDEYFTAADLWFYETLAFLAGMFCGCALITAFFWSLA